MKKFAILLVLCSLVLLTACAKPQYGGCPNPECGFCRWAKDGIEKGEKCDWCGTELLRGHNNEVCPEDSVIRELEADGGSIQDAITVRVERVR